MLALAPQGPGTELAGPPVAVHARRDHGAARPMLLHIRRGAIPHGVGAGVVAGINVRLPIGPVDRHATRLSILGRRLRDGHGRLPRPRSRRLRLRRRPCGRKPGTRNQKCNRHNPRHTAHPSLISGRTVSDWSAEVNCSKQVNGCKINCSRINFCKPVRTCRTCSRSRECGPMQKPPRSPKWKPWRMRYSSACRRAFAPCARA